MTRRHLRLTLERLRRNSPLEHSVAIDKVLGSVEGMTQLDNKVRNIPGFDLSAHPVLQWLWEHRQMILQIVLAIASLL